MFSPVNGKARLFCRSGGASLSFVKEAGGKKKDQESDPVTLLRRQELQEFVSRPIWVLESELWSVLLWVNGPV